jgi:hypothetical protein
MNIPLNRWTVGLVLVVAALIGGDFFTAVMRAVVAMGNAYVPAM